MDLDIDQDEWTQENISEIENRLLQNLLECRTPEAVEAAMTYARFLSSIGITPENYPLFLLILDIENHWVIDALIGDRDPFLLLSPIQPNEFIVSRVFRMMTRWPKGGIYGKNLSVILGVLQAVYSSPKDGYRIYQLKISDVNAMGKHLDKEKGQDDPLNRAILEVLEKISELEDPNDQDMEEVARHAAAVRNAFFDDRKRMDEVIPPVLLVARSDRQEVPPRRQTPLRDVGQQPATATGSPSFESSAGTQESPASDEDREAVGA